MSLNDIIGGVGFVAGATIFIYGFKKLMKEYYIPWTKKTEKELDNHPELEDYRFSDEDKK